MMRYELHHLVAAAHTPFDVHGDLNLVAVEAQATHLAKNGIKTVFVAGSTGESHSLSLGERVFLTTRWAEVAPQFGLKVVIHVGGNCLQDAATLAANASLAGVDAIASLAPSYFKPSSVENLVACCAQIASRAPKLPFYFYDIPALTGVNFSMPQFLELAEKKIPNLAGIKFTNSDQMAYQKCLQTKFDIPWGVDETMLAALALGAKGAVGSSFNFAAPIYDRLISAFEKGDHEAAKMEQFRSVQIISLLASYGYMAAAKATMGFLGVDVGQPRLPIASLKESEAAKLRSELEALGYFNWIK